ncbi:transporter substrate-binding domain-containing protein [Maioricimonas rarisocia]|uniref:transporter substrate-binding domain-containing protein n=1 Tax=Maioricimonas rarisocia TaxID=2528026 RepID=UPI0018D22627|nr:transporter substrate-binding domain-containing protein [Maioricimonas rarisocia]
MLVTSVACGDDETDAIPDKLVVATRDVPPFSMKNEDGQWTGLTIDLLREIKVRMRGSDAAALELEFREMGLDEMLDALERGEIDLAAAALTVNAEREARVDFTHPYYSSGLGIAVGRQQLRTWDAVLAAIFSLTFLKLMLALFAALLASGVIVYLFERKRNPEQFGGRAAKGIAAGIWWAAVTMTTVGYGDKVPKTSAGRVVGFIWMFAGLFIIASFTAAVTSALTVNQLKSRINGPADLSRVRVATVTASTSDRYLADRHVIARTHSDVHSALQSLKAGDVDAVVYDAPVLRYEAHQRFAGEVHVLPMTFQRQDYAFALRENSPLREQINQIVLRRIENPEWDDVLAGYFGEDVE